MAWTAKEKKAALQRTASLSRKEKEKRTKAARERQKAHQAKEKEKKVSAPKKTVKKEEPKEEDVIKLGAPKEDDTIRLGGEPKGEPSTIEKGLAKVEEVVTKVAGVFSLPKSIADKTIAQPIPLMPAASSLSLIGTHIDVDKIGKELGLTSKQTASLAKEIGRRRISEIANTVTNPKNVSLAKTILSKLISKPAMLFYGGWASSVMIGLWGVAESPESVAFPELKFLIADAKETGDWTLVDLAEEAKKEILDLKLWEKIALISPLSAFIGIPKKILGAQSGAKLTTQIIKDMKIQQETGETDDEKWERIKQQELEDDKAVVDYYNDERKKMVEWENEARLAAEKAKSKIFEAGAAKTRAADIEAQRTKQGIFEAGAARTRARELELTKEKQRIFEAGAAKARARELELAKQKQAVFETGAAKARAAEIKARNEDAEFWRKERIKQAQFEAEDRKAIADFWMAYRKEVYQIQQDNRPSNLNFGLL